MRKTVLVTGGSKGIGRVIAKVFARYNYNVIINYNKSESKAKEAVRIIRKYNPNVIAVKADVSDFKESKYLVEHSLQQFSNIDVLVNNSGISQTKLFDKITESDWDRMIKVNLKSIFNCCSHVVPNMLKRHSGNIINISSVWGIVGASCEVHYSAAKAGVIGFTKALSKELGASGIRVNCIAPGVIKTDMINNLTKTDIEIIKDETPMRKTGHPIDIAKTAYFLASDDSKFVTGQVISPNGGLVI